MSAIPMTKLSGDDAIPTIRLNDGNSIPQLGLGVWQVDPAITARLARPARSRK